MRSIFWREILETYQMWMC